MLIGWSISHQEFTINDQYYFSRLRKLILDIKLNLIEVDTLTNLSNLDILVFNYPENPFKNDEIREIHNFIARGGRVIVLGYYNNEDNVADCVNSLTESYGIILNDDIVTDETNSLNGDGLFIVTSKIHGFNEGVKKVLLPCTASLTITNSKAFIIAEAEATARSNKHKAAPILFAGLKIGSGELIVGGTCVFWDNYSIGKFDNANFSINLLTKEI